jgi:hypothetical protein
MPSFRFKAKNKEGKYSEGQIQAENKNEALVKLEALGQWVVALDEMGPSTPAAASPQPTAPAKSAKPNFLFPAIAVVLIIGCAVVLMKVLKPEDNTASQGPVNFTMISEEDYGSEGDYLRYDYTVEVESGASRGDIIKAAQELYAQRKKNNPKLQEAMLSFFYHGQNTEQQKPIAVLRWNWNKSNKWEMSFNLERKSTTSSDIEVHKIEEKDGEYVVYKFVIPNDLTIDGSEKVAREKLSEMRTQWVAMDEVRAELFYEGFDEPFMKCTLQPKLSANSTECEVIRN